MCERERARDRDICVYIYIYICVDIYIMREKESCQVAHMLIYIYCMTYSYVQHDYLTARHIAR